MRIIAGEFRHRTLHTPPDASITRPIPDRVKESLFSLLRGWTEDAVVLDAFAGTGAIGLECLSRGASRCVFVERDKRIIDLLRRNVEDLGCEDRAEIVQGDALGASLLSRCPRPVDLIFFDPPYPLVWDPPVAMGGQGGWDRVKLQFSRVIEHLNTASGGGYAVLRTPWPFRHRAPDQPADTADTPPSRRSRSERPPRRADKRGTPHDRAWEGEELAELLARDDDDSGAQWHADSDATPDAAPTVPVDLAIPGAIGPETHVYGNTAVHLYMKQTPRPQPAV